MFIAAQHLGLREALRVCSRAFFAAPTWPQRIWDTTLALLMSMATTPDLAYALVVEPNAAGARALQGVIDTLQAFTIFLQDGYNQSPRARALPPICAGAIVGAHFELLYHHLTHHPAQRLPELTPQIAYIALAPFIGPEEAASQVHALAGRTSTRA